MKGIILNCTIQWILTNVYTSMWHKRQSTAPPPDSRKFSHASFQTISKYTSWHYSNVFNTRLVLPLLEHHVNGNIQNISSVPSLVVSDSLQPHRLQHARPPCTSPTPGVDFNSFPLSRWCHPTTSSSVVPFSSWLQSFPALGSFQMTHFFASDGQSIGVSASTSVLPNNIQDRFPLGWIFWISLQSKRLLSLLQHHSLKASLLWRSAFFMI